MPAVNPPGSPVTSIPGQASAVNPGLPDTTPQAFAAYLDHNFKGSDGQPGHPLHPLDSLGFTGATIGDQWLAFYNAAQLRDPGKTLLQYEEAFVVLVEEAYLGISLAAGSAGGLGAGGALASSAATSAQQLGAIFSVFQSGSLWLRVGEVVIGVLLIAVGVAKMTGAVPIATKIASRL